MRITVTALTRMLRRHHLAVHAVIETTPMFRDDEEVRAADAAMWQEFGDLGLLDRRGGLDPHMLDMLIVLGRPSIEYFGWFSSRDRGYGVLVAGLGDDALVAIRGKHSVQLTPVSGDSLDSLPETLIRQLPVVRPARIEAVNIRRSELADDADHRSTSNKDISVVRQLIAQQPTGLGELHVAVRDRLARRRTTTEPVRYRDSRKGRVLVRLTEDYLSVAPADQRLLVERIRDAHTGLVSSI